MIYSIVGGFYSKEAFREKASKVIIAVLAIRVTCWIFNNLQVSFHRANVVLGAMSNLLFSVHLRQMIFFSLPFVYATKELVVEINFLGFYGSLIIAEKFANALVYYWICGCCQNLPPQHSFAHNNKRLIQITAIIYRNGHILDCLMIVAFMWKFCCRTDTSDYYHSNILLLVLIVNCAEIGVDIQRIMGHVRQ